LHITADYPDCNKPVNTYAVKNFIDQLDEFDNYIIAINRTALPWKCSTNPGGGVGDPRLISIKYWGFPFGILLALSLYIVARQIRSIVRARGVEFDLIHAHKLTFEGVVAFWLSRWTDTPMVCSIRGEVESKVLRAKPHYRFLYIAVARCAKRLYFVSAWIRYDIRRTLRVDARKERLLPNFVRDCQITPRKEHVKDALAAVMVLDDKRKGLDRLLPAFRQVIDRVPTASLDLIGRGTPTTFKRVDCTLREYGLRDHVRVVGPLDHGELIRRLPNYAGMVLPSRNETFGMAYVEALLSGVPILYSKKTGIDGFLDDIGAAVGVDPLSVKSVSDGLMRLLVNQDWYAQWLRDNADCVRARFSPHVYVAQYTEDVRSINYTKRKAISAFLPFP
jgi:glycosyltransferase involved in cell wall biosynthesis